MQQWGSLDFLYIWHFLIPFLHFDPASGHLFLTRSTLNEAGRSFLKWLRVVTRVPMRMCQHTAKQLRKRCDKVMLWTKRCIQTAEKERIGSKCFHVLIFVYPWCISKPTISSKISAVYGVCGDWGVEEEACFIWRFSVICTKKKDTSPAVRHQNDICFSHLHSRIAFFHIYSKNV